MSSPRTKADSPELSLTLNFSAAKQILEKSILGGILFILALPLLGDYGLTLFPLGRDIIFKLTVEFLILITFIRTFLVYIQKYRLPVTSYQLPVTLPLIIFWFIMALATLTSVQPEFSIWGNIYKNQGFMTWTHYVLFFLLLVGFVQQKKHWRLLIYAAIGVGILVSAVALWQVFQNGLLTRAASTLNNSNYLAAYLVLTIPVTFSFLLKKPSYFLGTAAILQFLALLATQTRGGYLGVAIGAFVFALLYAYSKKSRGAIPKFPIPNSQIPNKSKTPITKNAKRLNTGAWGLIGHWDLDIGHLTRSPIFIVFVFFGAVVLCSAVLFTTPGQFFQQKLPNFTDRFLSLENFRNTGGPRLEAWQAGWQGMLKRPLLGYGPENFFAAFDEFYSGSQDHTGSLANEGSLWESWFDKAHNFIFDIGVTTGFLGLFAYIAIFVSAILVLFHKLQVTSYRLRVTSIGLIAVFVGYLVQNLLGFDTTVPGLYLMFFLAYAHFVSRKIRDENTKSLTDIFLHAPGTIHHTPYSRPLVLAGLSFILIFMSALFTISINLHLDILKTNHELNIAETFPPRGQIEQAFAAFEKGLEYNAAPINPNLRRRYAVIALAYRDAIAERCLVPNGVRPRLDCERLDKDSRKYLTRALALQQENAATEWPRFTRNYIYAAQISHILGDYEQSDMFFEQALELSPSRSSIYTEWSRLLLERGEVETASRRLQKAREINKAIQ